MVFCGLALELAPAGYGLAELGWDRRLGTEKLDRRLGIHREAQLGIEKCREAQQEAAVKTLPPSHMLMLIANWSRKCKISWTKGCCRQTHNLFNFKSIATLTETCSATFLPLCQPQRKSWVKKMLCFPGHFNFNASFANCCELISCSFVATLFLPNSYVVVHLGERNTLRQTADKTPLQKCPRQMQLSSLPPAHCISTPPQVHSVAQKVLSLPWEELQWRRGWSFTFFLVSN